MEKKRMNRNDVEPQYNAQTSYTLSYAELTEFALENQKLLKDMTKQFQDYVKESLKNRDFLHVNTTAKKNYLEEWFTEKEVRDKLKISNRQMLKLRAARKIRFKKFGNRIRYKKEYVDEYVQNCDGWSNSEE